MSPFGSDFVGRPAPVVVSREAYRVPHGRVLCSCGAVVRVRVNGTVTKHDAWASNTRNLGVCPMSGTPATAGDKL